MTPEEREDLLRAQRRRQRAEERRRRERRARILTRTLIALIIIILALLAALFCLKKTNLLQKLQSSTHTQQNVTPENTPVSGLSAESETIPEEITSEIPEIAEPEPVLNYGFTATADIIDMSSDQVISTYGVLVDCDNDTIVANRSGDTQMNPASMTKILTILVAAEQLEDESKLDDTVTISQEITDYIYKHDCSMVGYSVGETIPVRELFYGTILPSGADAAMALAEYTAGSQEAFVDLMNQKLQELGLSKTAHFTNCIGLFDQDHYCTLLDMAVILKAAMDNELCRDALSLHVYTTTLTPEHPEGIVISNWFLRRIEDKDCGGTVVGAKTGFVNESGNCAASYFTSNDGHNYICVTGGATSSWRAIYDHVAVYNIYAVGNTSYTRGSSTQPPG